MESSPGNFWEVEYDYAEDGQITAEEWPGSLTTRYTYDGVGRLLRIELPVATGDKVRYEYDDDDNDGEDPGELSRIVHELTAGTDYLVLAAIRRGADGSILWGGVFTERIDLGRLGAFEAKGLAGSQGVVVVREVW